MGFLYYLTNFIYYACKHIISTYRVYPVTSMSGPTCLNSTHLSLCPSDIAASPSPLTGVKAFFPPMIVGDINARILSTTPDSKNEDSVVPPPSTRRLTTPLSARLVRSGNNDTRLLFCGSVSISTPRSFNESILDVFESVEAINVDPGSENIRAFVGVLPCESSMILRG